jgi:hypothetical protein
MKRLKLFFACLLFILALPMWRYLDMVVWVWPSDILYAFAFFGWSFTFIILPLTLVKTKKNPLIYVLFIAPISLIVAYTGVFSKMATQYPDLNHCGQLTYTGLFYPLHRYLPEAHAEDLEVRNQFCWVRKMISRLPAEFEDETELANFVNLTRDKLLKPEYKYRATLPLVALLHGKMFGRMKDGGLSTYQGGKMFVESLNFWMGQYTVEISVREYSTFSFPHGDYIKVEYGFIERNWRTLVDGIEII